MLFLFLIIGLTGSIVSALYLAIIKMLGKKNDNVLVIVSLFATIFFIGLIGLCIVFQNPFEIVEETEEQYEIIRYSESKEPEDGYMSYFVYECNSSYICITSNGTKMYIPLDAIVYEEKKCEKPMIVKTTVIKELKMEKNWRMILTFDLFKETRINYEIIIPEGGIIKKQIKPKGEWRCTLLLVFKKIF